MKGLYRRYDGQYVFVLGTMKDSYGGTLVRFVYLRTADSAEYCLSYEEFTSDTYVEDIWEDGKIVGTRKVDIKQHPLNDTGQPICHVRIFYVEQMEKNMSTDSLIEELRWREDSPLHDFDVDGFNDRVYCREYVVGVPKEDPECVSVIALSDSLEEAKKNLLELVMKGKRHLKIYKRLYIEEQL